MIDAANQGRYAAIADAHIGEKCLRFFGIEIDESSVPVKEGVRGACEIFGLDPLFVANEGKPVEGLAFRDTEQSAWSEGARLRGLNIDREMPFITNVDWRYCARIVETEPVVRGQTAANSFKPAILDNGVRIMVPPHIGAGTRIVVDGGRHL